ncbi:MAG TPA: hypothetical protein VF699_00120 [Caulobacteraceae bacterium]|jgi:hypothetical protein
MSGTLLGSILATGFAVAFLHAAIPTHWLPFVLVGRAQGWGARKILTVAMLAGGGHVASTALLGLVLTGAGMALDQVLGPWLARAAGLLLIGFGLYYLLLRRPHVHRMALPGGGSVALASEAEGVQRRYASDRAAILGLVGLLTFSPCESFLPVYLSGASYGWTGFLLLSAVLGVATVVAMTLFTGVLLLGVSRLRLQAVERYESVLLGTTLCVLGVLVMVLEG